jgi:hypothetical protein
MEIPRTTVVGLAQLKTVDDQTFKTLVKTAFVSLARATAVEVKVEQTLATKQAFAALCNLILVASKNDATVDEVKQVLNEAGLSSEQSDSILKRYNKALTPVRSQLAQLKAGNASIVGLTWRLDYQIRSDTYDNARTPLYFITLNTRTSAGELEDKTFTANLQELQDLHAKLKDAKNQILSKLQTK